MYNEVLATGMLNRTVGALSMSVHQIVILSGPQFIGLSYSVHQEVHILS